MSLEGISRRFGRVWAVRDVDLTVLPGEIHAVVGENGAGKTTLMNILFGHIRPDRGSIRMDGAPVTFRNPGDAARVGIGMVHQHLLVFPRLTALENIIVGSEPSRWNPAQGSVVKDVARRCEAFGFNIPLQSMAEDLSFAHRQQIELLRVLLRGVRVIILDEPTSLLAPPEVRNLMGVLKGLRARGLGIFFISHRMAEVLALADRVSVLRKGRIVATVCRRDATAESLAALMVGEEPGSHSAGGVSVLSSVVVDGAGPVSSDSEKEETAAVSPLVEVLNLSCGPREGEVGLDGLSLDLRPGECLGLGGVVGNGQRALATILAGAARADVGTVRFGGRDITGCGVRERIGMGFRWLPANLSGEALLPRMSLWENLLLGRQRGSEWHRGGRLRTQAVKAWAKDLLDRATVVHSSVDQPVASLSGGNQQKLVISRLLEPSARFLILEQPSRGLDFAARDRLHGEIRALLESGAAVLLISYDLDELLAVSHRVGILYRGRLRGMVAARKAKREQLGQWMTGGEVAEAGA